jgi:glycosyltransferase involved in cell wall biosynthesis
MTPVLSVIMANYNNAPYIEEAIESVIQQSFQEWELLVLDDASTDNSLEKVIKFNDPRIRILRNRYNLGYIGSLKRLIEEANTDVICILDSDDVLVEQALGEIHKAYLENPGCGFIYSNFSICDQDLNVLYQHGKNKAIPPGESNLTCDCVSHFKTFRKSAYLLTEGYSEEILYAEDKDISYKLEEVTNLFFVDQVLYKYRVLPDSQSNDPIKAKIGEASFDLAKFYAYKRRKKSGFASISKETMQDILDSRISILAVEGLLCQLKNILLCAYSLRPLQISYLVLYIKCYVRGLLKLPHKKQ